MQMSTLSSYVTQHLLSNSFFTSFLESLHLLAIHVWLSLFDVGKFAYGCLLQPLPFIFGACEHSLSLLPQAPGLAYHVVTGLTSYSFDSVTKTMSFILNTLRYAWNNMRGVEDSENNYIVGFSKEDNLYDIIWQVVYYPLSGVLFLFESPTQEEERDLVNYLDLNVIYHFSQPFRNIWTRFFDGGNCDEPEKCIDVFRPFVESFSRLSSMVLNATLSPSMTISGMYNSIEGSLHSKSFFSEMFASPNSLQTICTIGSILCFFVVLGLTKSYLNRRDQSGYKSQDTPSTGSNIVLFIVGIMTILIRMPIWMVKSTDYIEYSHQSLQQRIIGKLFSPVISTFYLMAQAWNFFGRCIKMRSKDSSVFHFTPSSSEKALLHRRNQHLQTEGPFIDIFDKDDDTSMEYTDDLSPLQSYPKQNIARARIILSKHSSQITSEADDNSRCEFSNQTEFMNVFGNKNEDELTSEDLVPGCEDVVKVKKDLKNHGSVSESIFSNKATVKSMVWEQKFNRPLHDTLDKNHKSENAVSDIRLKLNSSQIQPSNTGHHITTHLEKTEMNPGLSVQEGALQKQDDNERAHIEGDDERTDSENAVTYKNIPTRPQEYQITDLFAKTSNDLFQRILKEARVLMTSQNARPESETNMETTSLETIQRLGSNDLFMKTVIKEAARLMSNERMENDVSCTTEKSSPTLESKQQNINFNAHALPRDGSDGPGDEMTKTLQGQENNDEVKQLGNSFIQRITKVAKTLMAPNKLNDDERETEALQADQTARSISYSDIFVHRVLNEAINRLTEELVQNPDVNGQVNSQSSPEIKDNGVVDIVLIGKTTETIKTKRTDASDCNKAKNEGDLVKAIGLHNIQENSDKPPEEMCEKAFPDEDERLQVVSICKEDMVSTDTYNGHAKNGQGKCTKLSIEYENLCDLYIIRSADKLTHKGSGKIKIVYCPTCNECCLLMNDATTNKKLIRHAVPSTFELFTKPETFMVHWTSMDYCNRSKPRRKHFAIEFSCLTDMNDFCAEVAKSKLQVSQVRRPVSTESLRTKFDMVQSEGGHSSPNLSETQAAEESIKTINRMGSTIDGPEANSQTLHSINDYKPVKQNLSSLTPHRLQQNSEVVTNSDDILDVQIKINTPGKLFTRHITQKLIKDRLNEIVPRECLDFFGLKDVYLVDHQPQGTSNYTSKVTPTKSSVGIQHNDSLRKLQEKGTGMQAKVTSDALTNTTPYNTRCLMFDVATSISVKGNTTNTCTITDLCKMQDAATSVSLNNHRDVNTSTLPFKVLSYSCGTLTDHVTILNHTDEDSRSISGQTAQPIVQAGDPFRHLENNTGEQLDSNCSKHPSDSVTITPLSRIGTYREEDMKNPTSPTVFEKLGHLISEHRQQVNKSNESLLGKRYSVVYVDEKEKSVVELAVIETDQPITFSQELEQRIKKMDLAPPVVTSRTYQSSSLCRSPETGSCLNKFNVNDAYEPVFNGGNSSARSVDNDGNNTTTMPSSIMSPIQHINREEHKTIPSQKAYAFNENTGRVISKQKNRVISGEAVVNTESRLTKKEKQRRDSELASSYFVAPELEDPITSELSMTNKAVAGSCKLSDSLSFRSRSNIERNSPEQDFGCSKEEQHTTTASAGDTSHVSSSKRKTLLKLKNSRILKFFSAFAVTVKSKCLRPQVKEFQDVVSQRIRQEKNMSEDQTQSLATSNATKNISGAWKNEAVKKFEENVSGNMISGDRTSSVVTQCSESVGKGSLDQLNVRDNAVKRKSASSPSAHNHYTTKSSVKMHKDQKEKVKGERKLSDPNAAFGTNRHKLRKSGPKSYPNRHQRDSSGMPDHTRGSLVMDEKFKNLVRENSKKAAKIKSSDRHKMSKTEYDKLKDVFEGTKIPAPIVGTHRKDKTPVKDHLTSVNAENKMRVPSIPEVK